LQKIIAKVKKRANPDLHILLFRTLYDGRSSHAKEIAEEIEAVAGDYLLSPIIKRRVKFADSTARGVPLVNYAPSSDMALVYRDLAQEILTYGS
jgi:chromosome partitioning protein